MKDYIKEARKYYNLALQELEEARRDGKEDIAADACAKGWLALTLATNALFKKRGEEKLPGGIRGRLYLLKKHGDRELRNIHDRAWLVLHIQGYYNVLDRLIDYDRISECLEDVEEYIKRVEEK